MRTKLTVVVVIGLVILAYCPDTCATVIMDWVTVGDAGNVGELSGFSAGGFGPDRTCGAVDYTYQISKYEVTNAQYCEFLNAIASTDTYSLYHINMNGTYGGITQSGSSGSFEYSVKSGRENKPVNWVSWYDSIRFINWLQNGQGSSNTENGTYTIVDGGPESGIVTLPDHSTFSTLHFVLPTEDEWYKAAYYKGGSTVAGYWDYAIQSDTVPTTGQVNYYNVPGEPTDVGSYAFPSAYNTYDQNGNMWEWNEVLIEEPVGEMRRGMRGGSWSRETATLPASDRNYNYPFIQAGDAGFRVASVVTPATKATIDITPDLFEVEIDPNREAEEPEEEFLTAFIELPIDMNFLDVDANTVVISVNDTVLAAAESPEIVDDVLTVNFRLNLQNVSTVLGQEVAEVDVDQDEKVGVTTTTAPSKGIDLVELTISGELTDGSSFSGNDAVRVVLKDSEDEGEITADVNADGVVNFLDFSLVVNQWLESGG